MCTCMQSETARCLTFMTSLVQGSLLTITMYTWILVFSQPNPISTLRFFAFHPPLQTLGVLFFGIGILTLQPTSKSVPRARERGLKIHQIIQLGLGVPCILVGAAMMILNKIDHGAAHFTTWHAVSRSAPLVVRVNVLCPLSTLTCALNILTLEIRAHLCNLDCCTFLSRRLERVVRWPRFRRTRTRKSFLEMAPVLK